MGRAEQRHKQGMQEVGCKPLLLTYTLCVAPEPTSASSAGHKHILHQAGPSSAQHAPNLELAVDFLAMMNVGAPQCTSVTRAMFLLPLSPPCPQCFCARHREIVHASGNSGKWSAPHLKLFLLLVWLPGPVRGQGATEISSEKGRLSPGGGRDDEFVVHRVRQLRLQKRSGQ